jgi:hypothetical protein
MRFAPGGRATPGTVGILTASATTAVPRAIDGTRLDGGAVPVLTHSSSATKSARNAGLALCGLRGLTHGPGLGSVPGSPVSARARARAREAAGNQRPWPADNVLAMQINSTPSASSRPLATNSAFSRSR